jgi:hypothetical protein
MKEGRSHLLPRQKNGQSSNFSGDVLASRFFHVDEEMINPRPSEKHRQDFSPPTSVIWLRRPSVFLANLLSVTPVGELYRLHGPLIDFEAENEFFLN